VVGHFHFTIVTVGLFGLLAGLYYWFPLMTGRMYNTKLAKFHAFCTIFGMFGLFFMMAMLDGTAPGADGTMMMRRYATYVYAPNLQLGHILATGFAFLAGIGQAAFFANLLWSLRSGPEIENPWEDLLSGQNMPSRMERLSPATHRDVGSGRCPTVDRVAMMATTQLRRTVGLQTRRR